MPPPPPPHLTTNNRLISNIFQMSSRPRDIRQYLLVTWLDDVDCHHKRVSSLTISARTTNRRRRRHLCLSVASFETVSTEKIKFWGAVFNLHAKVVFCVTSGHKARGSFMNDVTQIGTFYPPFQGAASLTVTAKSSWRRYLSCSDSLHLNTAFCGDR